MYEIQPIEIGETMILELDDNGLYEGRIQMKKVSKYHRKKKQLTHILHAIEWRQILVPIPVCVQGGSGIRCWTAGVPAPPSN